MLSSPENKEKTLAVVPGYYYSNSSQDSNFLVFQTIKLTLPALMVWNEGRFIYGRKPQGITIFSVASGLVE